MTKLVWTCLLACVIAQPAWAAELTLTERTVHKRPHVYVHRTVIVAPNVIQLSYPRSLYAISPGRYPTACWAWMSPRHLRLVGWNASPCVSTAELSSGDFRFVEFR